MIRSILACGITILLACNAVASDYNYSGPVYIPESIEFGPASVYPIEFNVGSSGPVVDVRIALHRLIHPFFGDLVAGLRAPDGTSVYFLGGAGINGGNYAAGGSYTFDHHATASIAEYPDVQLIAPGSYKESVYQTDGIGGNPDPFNFGTYSTSLSAFYGHDSAGIWQLYLLDQYDGDKGQMNGATLSLSTAAVPEPSGWMLMMLGFGACGTALRRSRSEGLADASSLSRYRAAG